MPCVEAMLYVTGRNIAMAMVAVKPGMQPKIMPTVVPMNVQIKQLGLSKTEEIPSQIIFYCPLSQPKIPAGSVNANAFTKSRYTPVENATAMTATQTSCLAVR